MTHSLSLQQALSLGGEETFSQPQASEQLPEKFVPEKS